MFMEELLKMKKRDNFFSLTKITPAFAGVIFIRHTINNYSNNEVNSSFSLNPTNVFIGFPSTK